MPLLLHTIRQSRWLRDEARPWLERNDVPADAVSDLRTTDNCLSVWEVAPDRSNLERIVRAVALSRDVIANTGFIVFEADLLTHIGVKSSGEHKGQTPDDEANDWHRDLVDLSGNQLVALTRTLLENGDSGTVLKKRLYELVVDGIAAKQLPEKCRKKLP